MALSLLPESKKRAVGDSSGSGGPGSEAPAARPRWQTEQMRMMVLHHWYKAVYVDAVDIVSDRVIRRRPGGESPDDDRVAGYYLSTRWKHLTFADHFEARPPTLPQNPAAFFSHTALSCLFVLPPPMLFILKLPVQANPGFVVFLLTEAACHNQDQMEFLDYCTRRPGAAGSRGPGEAGSQRQGQGGF